MLDSAPTLSPPTPRAGGRLRYIDALRGIAALLVLWLHVANCFHTLSPATEAGSRWLNDYVTDIDIGRVGVVIFFLISGFVVPFSIRADGDAPIIPFAIKRFFRIYPAYWLSVPLGALTVYWMWGAPFRARDFLVNLTLLQGVFGIQPAQELYWTLLVELVFYLLCVVLLVSGSLFSMRRIGLIVVALLLAYSTMMVLHWLRLPGASADAASWCLNLAVMLWGSMYRNRKVAETSDRRADLLLWGLLAYFMLALPVGASLAIGVRHNVTLAYAIGFLIFVVGTNGLRIETRLTDWLGSISYSIYLFHPVVFLPIYFWLLRQPPDSAWRTQHLMVYLAVNLLLTLAVAAMVFRFVERPAIRLGRRLAARYDGTSCHRLKTPV